jgi:HK97 family phage portal protein
MNLLARIKAAFTPEKFFNSSMTILRGEPAKRSPFDYRSAVNAYRSWIYAAANLNAVAVASQPLRLYVRNKSQSTKLWNTRKASRRTKAYLFGDLEQRPSRYALTKAAEYGEDFEVVDDAHPILQLLSKVNPYQNGFDATVLRVLYGELTGNAYIHPVIDQRLGVPVQLWTMPSQFVEVVPGQQGEEFIKEYRYGATEEQKRENTYAPDEVIHFKRPNPADMYYGIGKVEAAWGAIMANEAIHEMDVAFFANKARPDYLLVVKSPAHDDELERLEVSIDEKLRGSKRTGRFLTTTADIDLKPLSFPPKDLAGREQIVEEIAAVFGVPVSMLKANDPNLASATVGFASWKQTTILPLLRMDEETLNQNLLPLFNIEEDAFLAYDNPVSEDERFAFEKLRSMVAGGIMTANEARMREGLEPVEDPMADALLVNGQPLGGPAPAAPLGMASSAPDGLTGPLDASNEIEEPPMLPTQPEQKDALSDCVSEKISKLIAEGYPQDQAVAIAYSMCAEGKALEEIETKAIGDIDTRPPQSVADNARRALEVRARKPESERGMTAVGIARARDLMNRVRLSEDTIRRMASYFERHEVDKQGSTWDEQGRGWQAWYGWGGDDGFAWAKRKIEEFDRERERNAERKKKCACGCRCGSISAAEMERKDCGTGAGGFQEGNTCGGEEAGGDSGSQGSRKESISRAADSAKSRVQSTIENSYLGEAFDNLSDEERSAKIKSMVESVGSAINSLADASSESESLYSDDGDASQKIERIEELNRKFDENLNRAFDSLVGTKASVQEEILQTVAKQVKESLGDSVPSGFDVYGLGSSEEEDSSSPSVQRRQRDRFIVGMKTIEGVAKAASIFEADEETGLSVNAEEIQLVDMNSDSVLKSGNSVGYFNPQKNNIIVGVDDEMSGRREGMTGISASKGFASSIAIHEIAHANHFKTTGGDPPRGQVSPELEQEMRNNGMREYAFGNELEFISCFVEDVASGKRMTPELWKFYDDLKGPKIKDSIRKAATYKGKA